MATSPSTPTIEAERRLIDRVERAMVATWPAPDTVRDGAWVIRRAHGYTERANSVTILDPDDDRGVDRRIADAERLFRDQGLDPSFRITPLTPEAVVAGLDGRGYTRVDETDVLFGAVPVVVPLPSDFEVESADIVTPPWLDVVRIAAPRADWDEASLRAICGGLPEGRAAFLRAYDANRSLGGALAAIAEGTVTFHAVATVADARHRGVARAIMAAGFGFAARRGIDQTWVAVVAANHAAQALYRGYGLAPLYRYHYRRAPS